MSIRHKKIPFHHKKIVNVCFCGRLIVEINIFSNGEIEIMSEPNDGKKEIGIDGDALGVRDDLIIGRFSLSFDGMESMTVMQRAEQIRHGLYEEAERLPQNKARPSDEVRAETDREVFLPNAYRICEKMIAVADERVRRAKVTFDTAVISSDVSPGRKAASIRKAINEKYDTEVAKRLSEERKRINTQKKEAVKYLKTVPSSLYAEVISDTLKRNGEGLRLTSQYLTAEANVLKYADYEKHGALTEEEKRLSLLAKELEKATRIRLNDHKQSAYLLLERDAALRLGNEALKKEAHARLLSCERDPFAFVELSRELTVQVADESVKGKEAKYYRLLQEKQNVSGFHPFKKILLKHKIRKTEREYSEGLSLLADASEGSVKYSTLTTLDEWKKRCDPSAEAIVDSEWKATCETEVEVKTEQASSLDLSGKIRAERKTLENTLKTVKEKDKGESEKELL